MPHYAFECHDCRTQTSRICLYAERDEQFCDRCGHPLHYVFVPTRSKAIVYGNDANLAGNPESGPPIFTGPRQRARYLKENGLVALGDEPAHQVQRWTERQALEQEAKEDAALEKDLLEGLADLGDALYTRDREAEPEPVMDEGPRVLPTSSFVSPVDHE